MKWQQLVPAPIRVWLKCRLRNLRDRRTGAHVKIAVVKNQQHGFAQAVTIQQPIMPGPYFDNKVHNIQAGAARINHIIIQPGQLFSFWQLVKKPTAGNGFKTGRNLINGVVSQSIGGGLCQLASIVYHTALTAGMHIDERHHHTIDIYKEEERFTPLGADAAVVYGYKDLRFTNTHTQPISLLITVANNQLQCALLSTTPLPATDISFQRDHQLPQETVVTQRNTGTGWVTLATTSYMKTGH